MYSVSSQYLLRNLIGNFPLSFFVRGYLLIVGWPGTDMKTLLWSFFSTSTLVLSLLGLAQEARAAEQQTCQLYVPVLEKDTAHVGGQRNLGEKLKGGLIYPPSRWAMARSTRHFRELRNSVVSTLRDFSKHAWRKWVCGFGRSCFWHMSEGQKSWRGPRFSSRREAGFGFN